MTMDHPTALSCIVPGPVDLSPNVRPCHPMLRSTILKYKCTVASAKFLGTPKKLVSLS